MTKILCFDPFSGIAGDMTLSALVDLGADPAKIEKILNQLGLKSKLNLEFKQVIKKGVQGLHFSLAKPWPSLGHQSVKSLSAKILGANFSPFVQETSLKILDQVAIAEAKIHGVEKEKVHFHEVGAIDSLVDVIGVAIALEDLGMPKLYSTPPALGLGSVDCSHGKYPIPAPASLEILKGLPIRESNEAFELTTPTGAAILKGLCEIIPSLPSMTIDKIGYGAGTFELENQPNILRAILGRLA
ncbi:MAG: LarC family nickel insertion protein [SAR324 cluster bacterium]|nr:LarC family nickel insertion protein [SAR324 cluster bacterium]